MDRWEDPGIQHVLAIENKCQVFNNIRNGVGTINSASQSRKNYVPIIYNVHIYNVILYMFTQGFCSSICLGTG